MLSCAMREAPIEQGTVAVSGGVGSYDNRAMFLAGFALSVYVGVCVYFVLKTLRRAALYNNWTVLTPAEQNQWLPYKRNDAGRIHFFRILLGGIFLVPWRLPLALLIVFSNGVWADGSFTPQFAFTVGYFFTYADIPYFMYTSCAAFVSKSALQKVPFIGDAADSLNCIYVDRENEADRILGLKKIKERCESLRAEPDTKPLVIFPEGTTTNGTCLLRFRRGAFCVFQPVQPVVLIYRCSHVDVAYELLPSVDWTLLVLSSSGFVKLEAYWLSPIKPPPAEAFKSDDERAIAFAAAVRQAMWEELCLRHPSPAAVSARKCPDWTGSGKLRMQLEQMLLHRQQQHVQLALKTSANEDEGREKRIL